MATTTVDHPPAWRDTITDLADLAWSVWDRAVDWCVDRLFGDPIRFEDLTATPPAVGTPAGGTTSSTRHAAVEVPPAAPTIRINLSPALPWPAHTGDGHDPGCSIDPTGITGHVCRTNTGAPVHTDQVCFQSARAESVWRQFDTDHPQLADTALPPACEACIEGEHTLCDRPAEADSGRWNGFGFEQIVRLCCCAARSEVA